MKDNNILLNLQSTKSIIEQKDMIIQSRNSYISKDEFIKIINSLEYDAIESAKIHFITGYRFIGENEKQDAHVKTLGFDFDIY